MRVSLLGPLLIIWGGLGASAQESVLGDLAQYRHDSGATVYHLKTARYGGLEARVALRGPRIAGGGPAAATMADLLAAVLDGEEGVEAWGGLDALVLRVAASAEDGPGALERVAKAAVAPKLSPTEVSLAKHAAFVEATRLALRSVSSGRQILLSALFGRHPYAMDMPDREIVRRADFNSLRRLHRRISVPDNVFVTVVGGLNRTAIDRALSRAFSNWRGAGGLPLPPAPAPKPVSVGEPKIYLVDRTNGPASVWLGFLTPSRRHPDFPALLVFNELIGGAGGGWVKQELRDRYGCTAEAGSRLRMGRSAGTFLLHFDCLARLSPKAVKGIFKRIKRWRRGRVARDEFSAAKQRALGAWLSRLEGAAGVSDLLVTGGLAASEETLEVLYKRIASDINDLEPLDLGQALRHWASGEQMAVAVLGPKRRALSRWKRLGRVYSP